MTPRTVAVTVAVETDDMDAVRDWLEEYAGGSVADDQEALTDYVTVVLISNSEYDGVPIRIVDTNDGGDGK